MIGPGGASGGSLETSTKFHFFRFFSGFYLELCFQAVTNVMTIDLLEELYEDSYLGWYVGIKARKEGVHWLHDYKINSR